MAKAKIVAEIGQAHDGSLGTAHSYIDASAQAGADFVKFQTHIAEAESHPSEPWRVRFSPQDVTRFDYWKRMEFTRPQWKGLYEHAVEKGVGFISSPFSIEAVEMLEETGIDQWKIASGEVSNTPMLRRIATDGRPVILSSGMSNYEELQQAIDLFQSRNIELTLLQCTSAYPCPPERLGLNLIPDLRDRFGITIGLSDHSGTIFAGLAAATLGASMLEIHVTFSKSAFGPDIPASLTFEELTQLCQGVDFIERAMSVEVDKEEVADEMGHLRRLFTRSIVTRFGLAEGHVITEGDLTLKKPGMGLGPDFLPSVVGRRVRQDLESNHILSLEDLEEPDQV